MERNWERGIKKGRKEESKGVRKEESWGRKEVKK